MHLNTLPVSTGVQHIPLENVGLCFITGKKRNSEELFEDDLQLNITLTFSGGEVHSVTLN